MIVLDASVLIAHLNPTDAHHVDATGMLLIAPPGSLLVHSMTLAEVLVGGARIGRGAQMQADLMAMGIQLTTHDQDEPLRLAEPARGPPPAGAAGRSAHPDRLRGGSARGGDVD